MGIRVFRLVLFLWFLHMTKGQAEYVKYKDPNQPVNVRVRDLLKRMTLVEKIGQMTQIERDISTSEIIKGFYISSLLSGGGSTPGEKASAADWVNMINGFQQAALSTRLGIPLIYGIDAVHGHNNAYNATISPHNVGLGVTGDPELIKRIGAATAIEVRATGIPYTFAPCIAVCRDPRWGRCYESYSKDPAIVREMTEIILVYKEISQELSTGNHTMLIGNMTHLVATKAISMNRIDDAVERILRIKFMMGLFEKPFADTSLAHKLGCQEHRELAREDVRKSLVLLKHGKSASRPMLPLSKKASRIVVTGTHAHNLGYQCGGWIATWLGESGNNLTPGTTILSAIKSNCVP